MRLSDDLRRTWRYVAWLLDHPDSLRDAPDGGVAVTTWSRRGERAGVVLGTVWRWLTT